MISEIDGIIAELEGGVENAMEPAAQALRTLLAEREADKARIGELEAGLTIIADEADPVNDHSGEPLTVRISKSLLRRMEIARALLNPKEAGK